MSQVWLILAGTVAVVGVSLWLITAKPGEWAPILYPFTENKGNVFTVSWYSTFALVAQSEYTDFYSGYVFFTN